MTTDSTTTHLPPVIQSILRSHTTQKPISTDMQTPHVPTVHQQWRHHLQSERILASPTKPNAPNNDDKVHKVHVLTHQDNHPTRDHDLLEMADPLRKRDSHLRNDLRIGDDSHRKGTTAIVHDHLRLPTNRRRNADLAAFAWHTKQAHAHTKRTVPYASTSTRS